MSTKKELSVASDVEKRIAALSPEKRKLLEKGLPQGRIAESPDRQEPVAIIGMACRFPGSADGPEAFWKLLLNGRDAITEVPTERREWNLLDKLPLPSHEMSALRQGGFLSGVDEFDPDFFQISPREAEQMDPQQRLLMMVGWEALEEAGQTVERLSGSETGVFMGIHSQSSDYYWMQIADLAGMGTYASTGGAHSIAANRLSYFLDLRGPSIVVDTACSSALVATHLACQSLKNRECRMALAGGVNLILSPESSIAFSKLQFLSRDGRCKTFDASANGFVRGEGCGIIVLRRLSDALKDGDPILAIIRGSAVNQDGATNGLTAPNGLSQQTVVRKALKNAGLDPQKITYIETHGTGTPLGDPIEIEALSAVIGEVNTASQICYLGAVKTNIGHLEAAAGIAGLIKTVLCMQHKSIPANLHFKKMNPHISLESTRFRIPTRTQEWGVEGGELFAGVSSFGFGGTNAHLILQEAPKLPEVNHSVEDMEQKAFRRFFLPFSARSNEALATQAEIWQEYLANSDERSPSLQDICFTASVRHTHHGRRFAVAGRGRKELIEGIKALDKNPTDADLESTYENHSSENGLVFVFSGQGPQWFGMGRQLLEQESVYREMIERCSQLLEGYVTWSLLDEMRADESASRMNQTEVAQPAIFALQMALAALWESWGIHPDALVGHSIGEVAASCYSGMLSLEDAVRVVFHRGRILQQATGRGRMAAVELSPEEAEAIIAKHEGRLGIAAVNSPTSVTISGETGALQEVLESLRKRNLFCQMLAVNYAFHSHQIEPYQEEMVRSVEGIRVRPAAIPVLSTVRGKPATAGEFGAAYWAENIRRPVLFAAAIDDLLRTEHRTFLELSPQPVLGGAIARCLAHRGLKGTLLSSLRRGKDEKETMFEALRAFYVQGRRIAWEELYPGGGRCVSLPMYPWQKKRYWITKSGKLPEGALTQVSERGNEGHFLTGRRLRSQALKDHVFEYVLNIDSMPFLADHRVYGEIILPAPVLIEIALSAARALFSDEFPVLEDFHIHRSLIFDGEDNKTLQVILKPEGRESASFEVLNLLAEPGNDSYSWEDVATGKIQSLKSDRTPRLSSSVSPRYTETKERCQEQLSVEEFYRGFGEKGVKLGPLFQAFESISRSEGEACARIRLPEPLEIEARHYRIHPVLLDACLQLLTATQPNVDKARTDKELYLFFGLDRFQQHNDAKPSPLCYATVQSRSQSEQEMYFGDAQIFNEEGTCVAEAKGICLKRVGREALIHTRSRGIDASLFKVVWHPSPQFDQMRERLAPTYLPSPQHIAEELQKSNIAVQPDDERHLRDALLPQLDQLCIAGILRAFDQLGWEMTIGEVMSVEDLVNKLGLVDQHRRLLTRMLEMLQEDGIVTKDGSRWRVILAPKIGDSAKMLSLVSGRYPEYHIELRILGSCLENLPGVLRGEIDPVNLLFPNGSATMAEEMYQDAPLSRRINALVRKAMSIIAEQVPAGRMLRILEIGGGTGGTTAHVLPELSPNKTEYMFTDISNFFLDKARDKFREWSCMSYRVLDIERDPEQQGIAPHQFDLILASNVVHATADLRQTLQHISQILAPDGLLLLVEGVRPARWIDLVFGLTTGWWRFIDTDLRPNHPLITRSKWIDVLGDQHFREATVVPPGSGKSGEVFEQALILAQAPISAEVEADHKGETPLLSGFSKQLGIPRESWLIFADQSGIGADLAEALQAGGESCIVVHPGQDYEILKDGLCRINPAKAEDYKLLARDILAPGKPLCRAAIFLWGIDAELSGVTLGDLERVAVSSCSSLVYLINSLLAVEEAQLPRIWIATRGAQSLNQEEAPQLGQAPLWGLGRVVAVEHPELWGGLIDLDPNGTGDDAALNLLNHICDRDGENQVMVRAKSCYIPCLVPWAELPESPLRWVPEGSYLITGGLGDLGLQTACWMVEKGARRLILLGRTPLPKRADWNHLSPDSPHFNRVSVIQSLEASGACVKTGSVDVSDEEELRSFLKQLRADGWTPIRGVIHTAVIAKDALLSQLDPAEFQQVWRPKATGAWLLHHLLDSEPLDFFILFSSLGSLLGQTGQGSYAAANAFLDALANHRRAHGQPAMSINWGSWIGSGLANTSGGKRTIQNLSLQGIEGISPQKATEAMGVLMRGGATQATVLGVNWKRFRNVFPSDIGYLTLSQWTRHWLGTASEQASVGEKKKEDRIRDRLLAVEQGPQRRSILESYLSETLADVLKQDVSAVHHDKPFGEMGLDSLMALQMKDRCERSLGLKLPTSMAWNHPTIQFLASYLSEKLGVPLDEPDQCDAERSNIDRLTTDELRETSDIGVLGSVDKLSDEEALQALLKKTKL